MFRREEAMTTCDIPDVPGCIRKMSRAERFFFMSPPCTVIMAARITGSLDETRFRQALATVSRVHPLLRVKIVFDKRHDAWFSSDGVPEVPFRVTPRTSDRQWQEELRGEARVPFDLGRGPLIKCVLLRSPDVSDLLVFCNHSICDGMALAILVRDLLVQYADPDKEVRVLDPPDALDLEKPGMSVMGIISSVIAGYANWKWNKNPYYFGPADYVALYRTYWEKRRPGLVLFEFDPAESARLQETCREHGVTVASAVSAACLAAHADITGGFLKSQQTVLVPYDLRRRVQPPTGDVFCFCAGGIRLKFAYSPEKPFWDNAVAMHKAIHAYLENPSPAPLPAFEPSLIDALAGFSIFTGKVPEAYTKTAALQRFAADTGNIAVSFNRTIDTTFPGFTPSNLGRIDMPDSYDGPRLDRLVFLPAASEINPLVLGGIGAGGGMVFTLPFVDPPAKTGVSPEYEMIRIRNRALEYLGFQEKVSEKAME
jgi:hypothetical protein